MGPSLEFLRGIVGVIGIGCGYMTGRAYALFRKRQATQFRLFGWVFRTVLCMIAVTIRHEVDFADIAISTAVVLAFSAGIWQNSRIKKEEDLTRTMFPDEPER